MAEAFPVADGEAPATVAIDAATIMLAMTTDIARIVRTLNVRSLPSYCTVLMVSPTTLRLVESV